MAEHPCGEDAETRAKQVVILTVPQELTAKLQQQGLRTIGELMGHSTKELREEFGFELDEISQLSRALCELNLFLCSGNCCQA